MKKKFILFIIFLLFVTPIASGDDVLIPNIQENIKENLNTAVKNVIENFIQKNGNSLPIDGISTFFNKIHDGVKKEGDAYVASTDFKTDENTYVIDFHVLKLHVDKIVLNKKDNQDIGKVLWEKGSGLKINNILQDSSSKNNDNTLESTTSEMINNILSTHITKPSTDVPINVQTDTSIQPDTQTKMNKAEQVKKTWFSSFFNK
jgi:hypothetical protein